MAVSLSATMQNPAKRHNHILNHLKTRGFVTVTDLGRDLDVSEATIRRDLRSLEERGLLYRTHGGANPPSHRVYDRPISEKAKQRAREKERIGRAAAALIEPNDSIILASGTTVMQVAKHIPDQSDLTIITSTMIVALELSHLSRTDIVQLGGMVRPTSTSVVGPAAASMIASYSCRKLFLGVDGLDIHHGLTTTNVLEAHLNQAMIAAAQETIVVTDSSKFGLRGFAHISSIDQIDKVITDTDILGSLVEELEDRGIEVVCV